MKHLPRILFALGCTAFLLVAEDFWVKKPFTEWSVKDATKLLQNSPWSHEVSVGGAMLTEGGSAGGGRRGGVVGVAGEAEWAAIMIWAACLPVAPIRRVAAGAGVEVATDIPAKRAPFRARDPP